jgi:hypothetical protein
VLVVASRDNELPRDADFTAAADAFFEKAGQQKLVAAGTPQPTRETRALPSETRQRQKELAEHEEFFASLGGMGRIPEGFRG